MHEGISARWTMPPSIVNAGTSDTMLYSHKVLVRIVIERAGIAVHQSGLQVKGQVPLSKPRPQHGQADAGAWI